MSMEDDAYRETKKALRRTGKALDIRAEDIEDLTSETVLILLKKEFSWDSLPDLIRLGRRMLKDRWVDWRRRARRRRQVSIDEPLMETARPLQTGPDGPYQAYRTNEQKEILRRVLQRL